MKARESAPLFHPFPLRPRPLRGAAAHDSRRTFRRFFFFFVTFFRYVTTTSFVQQCCNSALQFHFHPHTTFVLPVREHGTNE